MRNYKSDEELQGILSLWQNDDKVKLMSLGMYEARAKDFCAEDPQNYRVEYKHLVQLEIPKHFFSCLKTCLHHA